MLILRMAGMPEDQIFAAGDFQRFCNFISHSFDKSGGCLKGNQKILVKTPEVLSEDWSEVPGIFVFGGESQIELYRIYGVVLSHHELILTRAEIVSEVNESPSSYAIEPFSNGLCEVITFPFRKRN